MANKLMYIPNDDKQISGCNDWTINLMNQTMKIQLMFIWLLSQRYYKTFGTSVINKPIVPFL